MRETPLILVVDDEPANREILETRLTANGYGVILATNGREAVLSVKDHHPDLVLMDVNMPEMDGIEACKVIMADRALPYLPIIMVTALADSADVVSGLDAGAVEYLTKPVDHVALMARVRSMLRVKDLQDTVHRQARDLAELNEKLEIRVREQVEKLERLGRLKRFFSPKLAEKLLSAEGEELLRSHRREITVVFCDLRGFTAFSNTVAPEEVMTVLGEYHALTGGLVTAFGGTLEHFAGDGMMVFFNDPVPVPDHTNQAVNMADAMRNQMISLIAEWKTRGHRLGFGVGIDRGFATIGMIGFKDRIDYTAIGMVTNLASRLCDQAEDGQILVSEAVRDGVGEAGGIVPYKEIDIKGISQPVTVLNVVGLHGGDGKA